MAKKFDEKMQTFFDLEQSQKDLPSVPSIEGEIVSEEDSFDKEHLEEDLMEDYRKVRSNIEDLIEKGNNALDDILSIAKETEKGRDFEIAATVLKSVLDTNMQAIELHKKVKEIKYFKQSNSETSSAGSTKIQNALFIGSTTELSRALKKLNNGNFEE